MGRPVPLSLCLVNLALVHFEPAIMKCFLIAFALATFAFVATAELSDLDEDLVDDEIELDLSERALEEARGFMDLIPGGREFVEAMKIIGRMHKEVFLDPNLTFKEKVKDMMEIAKETFPAGLLAFGKFGLKIAVEKGLPLVIAAITAAG